MADRSCEMQMNNKLSFQNSQLTEDRLKGVRSLDQNSP